MPSPTSVPGPASNHAAGAEAPGPEAPPAAEEQYWAVIIGSGFGGAVTACRLAQALQKRPPEEPRRRILLLERGRRYDREDFPRLQLPDYLTIDPERVTSKRIPEIARMFWSHDQGLWDFRNLGELRVAQAAGLGGGSLVYCSVHLRPPKDIFEKWPQTCAPGCNCKFTPFDRDGLKTYYERAAEMLDIDPLPEQQRGQYPKVRAMRDVAAALTPDHVGKTAASAASQPQVLYPPLAVRFKESAPPLDKAGLNRFNRPQGDCTGCGNCTIGCQEGAKNTLDLNYLAVAQDLGVEIRTLCDVRHLEDHKDHIRIPYVDYLKAGTERAVRAQYVFLCAGAVGSTELLLRSRKVEGQTRKDNPRYVFERPERQGAKNDPLGQGFYANGDNLAVVFDSRKPISPTTGPTITSTILHRGEPDGGSSRWFLLQDGGVPPSLVESLGFFRSPLWLGRNRFRSPGMVPGRSFLSQLTSPAEPIGTVDRLMDEVNTRIARALGDPEGVSRPRSRPSAVLARALRLMVPTSLKPLVERAESVEKLGRQELRRINSRVVRLIDQRLTSRVWTIPFAPLRSVFATEESLVDLVAQAISEQYPVLRHLFIKGRGIDLALGLLRMLILGGDPPSENTGVMLVMGPDQKGSLYMRGDHPRVNWDNLQNAPLYTEQERLLRDAAIALGGELRTNPAWTVGRTPVTVHAQGGCGMSEDESKGVVRPCGRHWKTDRVYVMDAAAFPRSVGVNPAATIAAVAERNVEQFIGTHLKVDPTDYLGIMPPGTKAARPQPSGYLEMLESSLPRDLPPPAIGVPRSPPVGMYWEEEMVGYLATVPTVPPSLVLDELREDFDPAVARIQPFLAAERRALVAGFHVRANLKVTIKDLGKFFLSEHPQMDLGGTITVVRGTRQANQIEPFVIGNGAFLRFDLQRDPRRDTTRFWAGQRRLKGMTYNVPVVMGGPGRKRTVKTHGRKFIHDDPGIDVWADLSTLYVGCEIKGRTFIGVLRVSLTKFLQEQIRNMRVVQPGASGGPPIDEMAQGWAFLRLAGFFLGSVKNSYSEWF